MSTSAEGDRAVREAVSSLHRLAAELPDQAEVFPGFSDEAMDAWPVPVPEDVRVLLRQVGGLELFQSGFPWCFGPDLDAGGEYWRLGPTGSYWLVYDNGVGSFVYVDIDRESGRWGPVFVIEEEGDVVRVAPSLAWYAAQVAHEILDGLETVREDDMTDDELEDVLNDFIVNAGTEPLPYDEGESADGDGHEIRQVTIRPAEELRNATDPDLAAAAARVPDGTLIADLKDAGYPARCEFAPLILGRDYPFFERSHGGRFVYAFFGRV